METLIQYEDEHLLAVNKPAGMNTHAPDMYAGEGIYEWLKHRDPRRASLAILHRLDKETSGLVVFGKSAQANRSLTAQFTERRVRKKYLLLTDRPIEAEQLTAKSSLVRAGEKYISRPAHAGADIAETRFRVLESSGGRTCVEAEPVTGRTHQIRVHAAAHGFPVLGDVLYGGTAAPRVCLHAAEIEFAHPISGEPMLFRVPVNFDGDARLSLRAAIIDPDETNAFRGIHGASDGWPGWYVDRLGDCLLSQSAQPLNSEQGAVLRQLLRECHGRGVYHKTLSRRVRQTAKEQLSPQLLFGEAAEQEFVVRENGMQFALHFDEGYSVGLFLDQRENRRRLLVNHVAAGFPLGLEAGMEVLNTFAYTCAFSVCAAKTGARITSLDLSRKYLEWGRRNFALNGLEAAAHDFIYGDAFNWLKRLASKGRSFDLIILDPPTFSQSKERGVFRVKSDFGALAQAALRVLEPGGILFASTNAAMLKPERFIEMVHGAVTSSGREVTQEHYVPQPPDFPISHEEPVYLKTVWVRVS